MNLETMVKTGSEHRFSEELQWIAGARVDLNAFSPLYEKYYPTVYTFVFRRCADADDCLDLTSAVFEKAMLNIHKYEYRGFAFSTWLYRIAQNQLADYYRLKTREQKIWVRDEGLKEIIAEIQYDDNSEEQLEAVIGALQNLEAKERELICMRYFEKREYEELAAISGSNVNNIRVKLHRIIQKIRTQVERGNIQ